jgi:hypothetical protein
VNGAATRLGPRPGERRGAARLPCRRNSAMRECRVLITAMVRAALLLAYKTGPAPTAG